MTRLFLSLYLFIAISLVVLSAGLERVFFNQHAKLSHSQQAWLEIFETKRSAPDDLISLLAQTQFEVIKTNLNDIAVAESINQQLTRYEIVHGFSRNIWQIYIPIDDNVLLDVRLQQSGDTANTWWLYSGVFFILLGGVIAIWMYPLWRDLRKLIKTTGDLHADGSLQIPRLSQRSPLFGIASALESLSLNVKSLLQNQREFSGAITHEFRTPLARLKFALADDLGLSPKQMQEVRQDIDELDQLIQEMLDFTKLDVHQPDLHIEDIPLIDLCEQRADKFRNSTTHKITVRGEHVMLTADGHYIARALDNLLSNAIRHARSTVEITLEQTVNTIIVHIDDDGSGIEEQHRASIFSPFYRPDAGRDRQQGGAGLGLAIVKRIQHWHKGGCCADDSPLGGARFTLSFPNSNV